ncbi:AraC family transcriptional regulator [Compostibacter hankyongensis]
MSLPYRWKKIYDSASSYILTHLDERLSIDSLCRMQAVSPYLLQQSFRAATGLSVHVFIRRMRLRKAARMMRRTPLPLKNIALRVGFHSFSSFNHAFRKAYGCIPSVYRDKGGK